MGKPFNIGGISVSWGGKWEAGENLGSWNDEFSLPILPLTNDVGDKGWERWKKKLERRYKPPIECRIEWSHGGNLVSGKFVGTGVTGARRRFG